MAKENAILENEKEYQEDSFDFNDLEKRLQSQLDLEFEDLDFLQNEKEKIGNPDNLGETIKDVIWEQFINQIAVTAGEDFIKENNGLKLDLRKEAHIQTSDNFENGKIATHNYMSKEQLEQNYDRYKNTHHKEFRKKHVNPGMDATLKRAGKLKKESVDTVKDIYTGRQIPTETKLENGKNNPKAAQREHVKSSAELYRDPSLQMANSNKELADIKNNPENLQGYTTAERNNRKSNNSANEMSEQDKNKHWEKANQRAEEFVEQKKKEGKERLKTEGSRTQKEEAFRIGGKALRGVVMQLLADLVKEIIAKLVKWFKSSKKALDTLLDSLKEAIHSFVSKMKKHLLSAGNTVFSTIATAIIGPIFSTIKKVWMLMKQSGKAVKEAIVYIKSPENKGKPIDRLILETGKILIAGLTAGGAIVLGEVIEKGLMVIPIFAIDIPLIGSLANIIGILMGAISAGVVGAIIINLIEKSIEKKHKGELVSKQIEKANDILIIQREVIDLNEKELSYNKKQFTSTIKERHEEAANYIGESMHLIFDDNVEVNNNKNDFNEMDSLLDELLK